MNDSPIPHDDHNDTDNPTAAATAHAEGHEYDLSAEANSLVERLRERRDAMSLDRTEVIALPGHDELGMRYRAVGDRELNAMLGAQQKGGRRGQGAELQMAADFLIRSAVEACVWDDTLGDWIPIHDHAVALIFGEGEVPPVRFDARLVKLLRPNDPEPKNARAALAAVIPLPLAVADHTDEVMQWQQGLNRQISSDLAGE